MAAILASDGSTTVGALVRRRRAGGGQDMSTLEQDGVPDGTGHTIRLPCPTFMGDRHINARFTEGAMVVTTPTQRTTGRNKAAPALALPAVAFRGDPARPPRGATRHRTRHESNAQSEIGEVRDRGASQFPTFLGQTILA